MLPPPKRLSTVVNKIVLLFFFGGGGIMPTISNKVNYPLAEAGGGGVQLHKIFHV